MIRKSAFVPALLAIFVATASVTAFAGDKDTPPPAPRANSGFVSGVFVNSDINDVLKTIFLQAGLSYSLIGDFHSRLSLTVDNKYWNDITDVIGMIDGLSIAQNEIGIVVVKLGHPTGTIADEVPLALDPKDSAQGFAMEFQSANAVDVLRSIAIQGKLNLILPDLTFAPAVTLDWGSKPVTPKNALISVAEIIGYYAYENQGIFYLMRKQ